MGTDWAALYNAQTDVSGGEPQIPTAGGGGGTDWAAMYNAQSDPADVSVEESPYSYTPPRSLRDKLYYLSSQALQGLTFGTADEIEAQLSSLINPETGDYEKKLKGIREENAGYSKEYPRSALAANIAGGALLAPVLPAGSLATLGRAATTSALAGGAYGAMQGFGSGEGGFSNRMKEAVPTAMIGAGTGGVLGAGAYGVGKGVKALADALSRSSVSSRVGNEVGAIGKRASEAFDDADLALLSATKRVPADKLNEAIPRLAEALSQDKPLFLPEAIDDPYLYKVAKDVANDPRAIQVAEPRITGRNLGQGERLMDDLSKSITDKVTTPEEGGTALVNAAKNKISSLLKERSDAAQPIYKSAYSQGVVENPELSDVLSEPVVKEAIKGAKRFNEYKNLPDDHITILDQAQRFLWDKADSLKRVGNKNEARLVTNMRDKLLTIADEANPEFARARATFSGMSDDIDKLSEGAAKVLVNLQDQSLDKAGKILMSQSPKTINELKTLLGPESEDAIRAGVRAHLQTIIENTADNRNALSGLISKPVQRQRLIAALGEEDFNKLMSRFGTEELIAKGKTKYTIGSDTQSNLEMQSLRDDTQDYLGKVIIGEKNLRQVAKDVVDSLINSSATKKMDDKATKLLAETLFNASPEQLARMQRVARYRTDKAMRDKVIDKFTRVGTQNIQEQGGGVFRKIRKLLKEDGTKKASAIVGVGAAGKGNTLEKDIRKSFDQEEKKAAAGETKVVPAPQKFDSHQSAAEALRDRVIKQESNFDPTAVSPIKKAKGLMQLMDATGREMHKKLKIFEPYDPFDPEQNVKIGTAYLAEQLKTFGGDQRLALAAYNAGPGRLKDAIGAAGSASWQKVRRHLPAETRNYVTKILKLEEV